VLAGALVGFENPLEHPAKAARPDGSRTAITGKDVDGRIAAAVANCARAGSVLLWPSDLFADFESTLDRSALRAGHGLGFDLEAGLVAAWPADSESVFAAAFGWVLAAAGPARDGAAECAGADSDMDEASVSPKPVDADEVARAAVGTAGMVAELRIASRFIAVPGD
jgi:hypothetical protein